MDKRENKSWTEQEEAMLLWYYQNGKTNSYIRKKLGRSEFAVSSRLSKLRASTGHGSRRLKSDSWTAEEDATLIDMYEWGDSYDDIGFALGRTAKAAQMRAYNLRQTGQLQGIKSQQTKLPPQMDLFKPKPVTKPKPVREVPNKPTVKPKQLMKRQGWWSRLRHGDKSLEARVADLEAEVRGIHIALNKLLSELGEDRC